MGRKVGIYGGTFDPPHIGHLALAAQVRDALNLDTVYMMVAHDPWTKSGDRQITPSDQRLALVSSAVRGLDRVEPSDLEIMRGGQSYTTDTLAQLHDMYPEDELWLILGADVVADLPDWERGEEIKHQAKIAAVERDGVWYDTPALEDWDITPVDILRLDVSSTKIREMINQGRSTDVVVPSSVRDLIDILGLYR